MRRAAAVLVWCLAALLFAFAVGCRSPYPNEFSLTYGAGDGSLNAGPDRARYDADMTWVAGTLTWYLDPPRRVPGPVAERKCQ